MAETGVVLATVLLLAGCADDGASPDARVSPPTSSGQASFGSDEPVDLAIYFRDGVTDQAITDFMLEVLSKPPVPGRQGQAHLDGVQYTGGDYTRKAAYVTFEAASTEEQRLAVFHAAEAWPTVERIARDVVPSETPTE